MTAMQEATSGMQPATDLHEATRADLEALLHRSTALRFACVGTADGRLFAHAARDPGFGGERVAAMTSSMIALGESFAKDALHGRCDYSVISTGVGAIIVVRILHANKGFMLSVGSDRTEVLASTLRSALDAAERISKLLGHPATAV